MTEPLFPPGAALVIGGSGGIGQAICRSLAEAGCTVIFSYHRQRAQADTLADNLRQAGHSTFALPYRAGEPQAAQRLFTAALARCPRIHTVVNAAGSSIPMRFISTLNTPLWQEVIHADLNGFFSLAHACLPHLRMHGGSIVQISSIGLRRWPKRDVLSVAPKAGIEALIRGIAREEGRFGVRANSIQLGVIDAGLFQRLRHSDLDPQWVEAARDNTALKRFGRAEDVAAAVLFLASSRAAYITGEAIRMDGGFSL